MAAAPCVRRVLPEFAMRLLDGSALRFCCAVVLGGEGTRKKPTESSQATENRWLKEETHAARWGLLRGYSGKATKWVDFVVTDSTRRESCHTLSVVRNCIGVKCKWWKNIPKWEYSCALGNLRRAGGAMAMGCAEGFAVDFCVGP